MADSLPDKKTARRVAAALFLILLYFFLYDVIFFSYDRRGLIDHDAFYAGPALRAFVDDETVATLFLNSDRPPFINIYLLEVMKLAGTSLIILKLFNFPFFALILLGVYFLGKRIDGPETGVAAAFLAGSLPVTVNLSRKFFFDFHTVGPFLLAMALVVGIGNASRKSGFKTCLLIGVLMGLAFGSHPVAALYAVPVFLGLAYGLLKNFRQHPIRAAGLFLTSAAAVLLTAGPWYILRFLTYFGQKKDMGFFEPLSVRIQKQGWGDFFLRIFQARPYSEYSGEVFFSPVHYWLTVPFFLVLAFCVTFRDGRKSLPGGVRLCFLSVLYLAVTEAVLTYYPVQQSQVIGHLYLLLILIVFFLRRALESKSEQPPVAVKVRRIVTYAFITAWLAFGNIFFLYSLYRSADADPGKANPLLSRIFYHMNDDVFIRSVSSVMFHLQMIPGPFERALSAIAGYYPTKEPVTTRFLTLAHENDGGWRWTASKYGRFENDWVTSDTLKKKILIEGIRIKPENEQDPPDLTLLTVQSLEDITDTRLITRRKTEALALIRERFKECPLVFAFPITQRLGKQSPFTDHLAVFLDTRKCLPPEQTGLLNGIEEKTFF